VLAAARRLISGKMQPKMVKDFLAKEAELRMDKGEPGTEGEPKPTMAKLSQETTRIDSDIALQKKPDFEQAAAPPSEGRVMFPKVDTSKGDALSEDRQSLHDYIDALNDAEYDHVAARYGDEKNPFDQVVNTTSHPAKMEEHLRVELDPDNAEKAVASKKKITTAADIEDTGRFKPTKPGAAASVGTSRADLLAEANAKYGGTLSPEELAAFKATKKAPELPGGKVTSPEERIASEKKAIGNTEPEVEAPKAAEPEIFGAPGKREAALTLEEKGELTKRGFTPEQIRGMDLNEADRVIRHPEIEAAGYGPEEKMPTLDQATKDLEKANGKEAPPGKAEAAIDKSTGAAAEQALKVGKAPPRARSAVDSWWKRMSAPIRAVLSPTTMGKNATDAMTSVRKENGIGFRSLAQFVYHTRELRPFVNALPENVKIAFMKAMETDAPVSAYLPELQPLAKALKDAGNSMKDKILKANLLKPEEMVKNFFPHMWKDPVAAREFLQEWFGEVNKQGSAASLHKRSIPTIADGLKRGLELASTDPLEVYGRYMSSMQDFITQNRILDTGREAGHVKEFAQTTVGASGHPDSSQIPIGWTKLVGRGLEGKTMYAPEEWAAIYNAHYKAAWGNVRVKNLFDGAQRVSNAVTGLELGLSAFHGSTMAREAIMNEMSRGFSEMMAGRGMEGAETISKAPAAPYLLAKNAKEFTSAYMDPANATPKMQKLTELFTHAGGRGGAASFLADPTYRYSAQKSFWNAWKDSGKTPLRFAIEELKSSAANVKDAYTGAPNKVEGAALAGLKGAQELASTVGRTMQTVAQPLFEHYIPALKNGAFKENMASWLKSNPGASEADQLTAAQRFVDSGDNRFGEMVNDNIFWPRALKQVAQIMMRSYSWNLGTVREIGIGGMKLADPRQWKNLSMAAGKDYDPRMAYAATLPAMLGLTSMAYQMIKTGTLPQEPKDLLAGRTGGKTQSGTPERARLPGYEKDVMGWFNDAKEEAYNKIATVPKLVYETLTNKDFAGHVIADARKPAYERFGEYLNHVVQSLGPISLKQMAQGEKHGSNISLLERALAIRPAESWLQEPERIQTGIAKGAKHDVDIRDNFTRRQQGLRN
jgi:hypothetical protein